MELGQRISFKSTISPHTTSDGVRVWERNEDSAGEGMVVGLRHVFDGSTVKYTDDSIFQRSVVSQWTPHTSHAIVLVVTHIRRNPLKVLLEDVL